MRILLIHAGDFRENYFREMQKEYEKRLCAFCDFKCVCVKEENCDGSDAQIKKALEKEGEKILSLIPKGAFVCAMCVEGRQLSSEEFAKKIEEVKNSSADAVFIIGSSCGLADSVKSRANLKLSVSKMTLPHRLARVLLTEQIYRAFMIANHRKYHK